MRRALMPDPPGIRRRDGLALAAASLASCAALPLPDARAQASPICTGDEALCRLIAPAGLEHSNTHALLVEQAGRIRVEAYFRGQDKPSGRWFEQTVDFSPETPHDLRSITKSVVGLLGFGDVTWRTGWRGKALAYSGLRLTPRQLAQLGRLVLTGGRWQRAVLVPESWVAATMTPGVAAADGFRYSRQWWHGRFTRGAGAGFS